jgi:F-type H+-transporting ATPase subunit gamma
MASLKEIRTRMGSVKTTKQVTSAMKMVSAAKLRQAQETIIRIRPYADKLYEILGNLNASLDADFENIYGEDRGEGRVLLVVINSNRGLCGAFNANVTRKVQYLLSNDFSSQFNSGNLDIIAIGKNAYDYFRRRGIEVVEKNSLYDDLSFDNIAPVAEAVMEAFAQKKYDKVYLIYNSFKNAATQELMQEQFLPIEQNMDADEILETDYLYEPSKEEIVSELIPKSLKIQFYRALLDSNAAEHGARMTAMHQATDNATELLRSLNLEYNKARQASITNEILEIVGGAEALNG